MPVLALSLCSVPERVQIRAMLIVRTGRVGADFTGGSGRDPMHFHSVSPPGKPALTVTLHK